MSTYIKSIFIAFAILLTSTFANATVVPKKADFVFIVDASGSVMNEITAIKNGLSQFATGLDQAQVDAQFAIVLIGQEPEIVLQLTSSTDDVVNAFDSISVYGAVAGFQNSHYLNPEAGLEAIRMVLGAANNSVLPHEFVGGDGTINFRADSRKNLILVTDEDSDRPFYPENRNPEQFYTEPPFYFTSEGWQQEVDITAQVVIDNNAYMNMLVNPYDYPTQNQYGSPASDVSDFNLLNYDPAATRAKLIQNGYGQSLQAQVLGAGLIARTFDINRVGTSSFVDNFFAAKVEEVSKFELIPSILVSKNPTLVDYQITLDGSQSAHQDPEKNVVSWEWDLDNDGTYETAGAVTQTMFAEEGEYTVKLRVTDDGEEPETAEAYVIIKAVLPHQKPIADAGGPYNFCENNEQWYLDGAKSINPDNGLSEDGAPADKIIAYVWDLDGNSDYLDADGINPEVKAQLAELEIGNYPVKLRVTDNTAESFPSSGLPNQSDTALSTFSIRDKSDLLCSCLPQLTLEYSYSVFGPKVTVAWNDSNADGFNVYRSATAAGPYELLTDVAINTTSFDDDGIEYEQSYYYKVSKIDIDGNEICTSISVAITIPAYYNTNYAPTITSTPVLEANENTLYQYDVNATDYNYGDVITYGLEMAPSGMTIDASTGMIEWTPVNAQVGEHNVRVIASDQHGAKGTQIFTVQVGDFNQPPEITSSPELMITETDYYQYSVLAFDPDLDDQLTYSLIQSPEGMVIDSVTGDISWQTEIGTVGVFAVKVIVADTHGATDNQVFDISVVPLNRPPVITSTAPEIGKEEELYHYQVIVEDPDVDDIHTYTLEAKPEGMQIDAAAGLIQWTPAVGQAGTHTVNVIVTDLRGLTDAQEFEIAVAEKNYAPSITSSPITTGREEQQYTYSVQAQDQNADEVLTYSLDEAPTGMTIDATTGLISWIPAVGQNGSHAVIVRVTDDEALFDTQPFEITVIEKNYAPLIISNAVTIGREEQLYTYDVEAQDANASEVITFSLDLAPTGMTIDAVTGVISWIPAVGQAGAHAVAVRVTDDEALFGTQTFDIVISEKNYAPSITSAAVTSGREEQAYAYAVTSEDQNAGEVLTYSLDVAPEGMTIDAVTGVISWTPSIGQNGTHLVTVRVTDDEALFGTQSFEIVVAEKNYAPSITSTAVTSGREEQAYTYAVTSEDQNAGEVLTYSLDVAPEGMIIDAATGVISWTPSIGQNGTHPVIVRVTDDEALFGTQTFDIVISEKNYAPSITSAAVTSGREEQAYAYAVTSEDQNAGEVLTYSLDVAPEGMTIDAATGVISWIPAVGQNGTHPVTVKVTDDEALFGTQLFEIVVIEKNYAPTITSTAVTSGREEQAYNYAVTSEDQNADEVLTYSLDVAPEGMTIDAATGVISWIPAVGQNGTHPVTVKVTDDEALFGTQLFEIVVIEKNYAPTITSTAVTSGREEQAYNYAVTSEDQNADEVLTYSLDVAPEGMTIDAVTGVVSWTPAVGQAGNHSVVVEVSDGYLADQQSFVVVVETSNLAPFITSTPTLFVIEDETWNYTIEAEDPNGDSLIYSLEQAPEGVEFDADSGAITWLTTDFSTGTHEFKIKVSDGDGLFEEQQFSVEILPAERVTTHEGTEFRLPITLNHKKSGGRIPEGNYQIFLVSHGVDANVNISMPLLGINEQVALVADELTTFNIPLQDLQRTDIYSTGQVLNNSSIHIISDNNIAVYVLSQVEYTTDGFVGLPVSSLGKEYIVGHYRTVDGNACVDMLCPIIGIVATEDDTSISIKAPMDLYYGDNQHLEVGDILEITLNAGDVYNLAAKGSRRADLTGTIITSGKKIAVFGEHMCAKVPAKASACDHLVEQIPPIDSLGTDYITAPLYGRGSNIQLDLHGDAFRIIAPENNTNIYINGVLRAKLNSQEYFEFYSNEPQQVHATHPVLLMQYSTGDNFDNQHGSGRILPKGYADPFMVVVPPSDQYLQNYTVTTPAHDIQYNYINVLIPTDAIPSFTLDGNNVAVDQFKPIEQSLYSYAQLNVEIGAHHLNADKPFGVYVYGFDHWDSYGYLGGMAFSLPDEVNTLSVTADSSQPIGEDLCMIASVLDDYERPVHGARVAFEVDGIKPTTGYVYSDPNGEARYCYTAYKTGDNLVKVKVGEHSKTHTVTWTEAQNNLPPVIVSLPELTTTSGNSYSYQVEAFDPNNDELIYTLAQAPDGMIISENGLLEWPVADVSKAQKIIVKVQDAAQASTKQSFVLTEFKAINTPPKFDVSVTGATAVHGVPYTYNPIYLDHSQSEYKYNIRTTDAEGDAVYVELVSPPEGAYVERKESTNAKKDCTGCFQFLHWIPQASGTYQFKLNIRDSYGAIGEAQNISVDVAPNIPPQIVSGKPHGIATVGVEYIHVVDIENDVPMGRNDNLDDLRIVFDQHPGIRVENTFISPTESKLYLSWTPKASQIGIHTVRMHVEDRLNSSEVQEFTIEVVDDNHAPVFTSSSVSESAEATMPFEYQAIVEDADNDPITFELLTAPDGMQVDDNGLVTWTPPPDDGDTSYYKFMLAANDGRGGVTVQSKYIMVSVFRNDPPKYKPAYRPATAKVGVEYVHQVEATDIEGDPFTYSLYSSPEGSTIDQQGIIRWIPTETGDFYIRTRVTDDRNASTIEAWKVTVIPETESLNAKVEYSPSDIISLGELVTLTVVPENAASTPQIEVTVDGENVVLDNFFQAQIMLDRIGKIPVVVSISDGNEIATIESELHVLDPEENIVIISQPNLEAIVDELYEYDVKAYDSDGDALSYALLDAPVGMTIDTATGLIQWTPSNDQVGSYILTVSVEDGNGGEAQQIFTLTVSASDLPYLANEPTDTATVDEYYRYRIYALDADGYTANVELISGPQGMVLQDLNGYPTLQWFPEQDNCEEFVTLKLTDRLSRVSEVTYGIRVYAMPKKLNRIQCSQENASCNN